MVLSNGLPRRTVDEETFNPLDGGDLMAGEERWDSDAPEVGNTTSLAVFDIVRSLDPRPDKLSTLAPPPLK